MSVIFTNVQFATANILLVNNLSYTVSDSMEMFRERQKRYVLWYLKMV